MQLNILLRGQSNAQLMGDYNGGAETMVARVEQLLGFDGVTDKIALEYASHPRSASTVFSGTALLGDWLKPDGQGWADASLERSLLNYVARLPAAQKAEPTAVVWFHSEYDSRDAALTSAEWEGAVRTEAAQLRATYGQPAETLAYHFVSAIPYSEGSDVGHQAIRVGMEELAADPAFNGRIGARALDTDMSFNNLDDDWSTRDYGGPHQSNADGLQTAERLARSIAQDWAEYAKPGSPVALAGGQVDDLGPQVIQAAHAAPDQLALTVAQDAATTLATLEHDAAQGTGWSVYSASAGVQLDATAASLTGSNTLLLTFGEAVPADARLFYGYGYGRLAGEDHGGRGNAVYDDRGMPIWVDSHGLLADGSIHAPITDGTTLLATAGPDRFEIAPGAGSSSIAGFTPGVDHLVFTGSAAESITVTPGADGLTIGFDAEGHALALPGVAVLEPGDILFA